MFIILYLCFLLNYSGKREERQYVNGILTGPAVIYGPNGDKFEFTYVDGKVQGKGLYTTPSGAWEERTFVNGNNVFFFSQCHLQCTF